MKKTQIPKPRSRRAILQEQARLDVIGERVFKRDDDYPLALFQGAQQALSWALRENAASASSLIDRVSRSRKRKADDV